MWPFRTSLPKSKTSRLAETHRNTTDFPLIQPRKDARPHELDLFRAEVRKSKSLPMTEGTKPLPASKSRRKTPKKSPVPQKGRKYEILPTRVGHFDAIVEDGGFERGAIILLSGGAGTGKTTFSMQSLYQGVLAGEKGIYLTFEESPDAIKRHMRKNYHWDFDKLEEEGRFAFVEIDPAKVARSVEAMLAQKSGELKIKLDEFKLPFIPDRIAVDSLSALAIAFGDEENYRRYIMELFDLLRSYDAISIVLSETEQNPQIYSRTGVEEFLADGVVVLYNLKMEGRRMNALEILKLRASKHEKQLVPYSFTENGLEVDYLDLLKYRKDTETLLEAEKRKVRDALKKKGHGGIQHPD